MKLNLKDLFKKKTEGGEPKEKKPVQLRVNLSDSYDKLQSNIPALVFTFIFAIVLMGLVTLAVFFTNVKGPEKVLVPNVVGKDLEQALLEMQVKELYPKINLRYSDVPGQEGKILSQDPAAGAIVKGYSRVNLVVSRGVIVDSVGDYIGKNIDEVQLNLQTIFAGHTRPLIVLDTPEYKPDVAPAGTILEQNPVAGTNITEPVTVKLIVSRGPNYENTRAPNLVGKSINDLLLTLSRSKLVFDISAHPVADGETPGTVVSQQTFESEFIPNYSRVAVEVALPVSSDKDEVTGVFAEKIALWPFPVSMRLEAVPLEGEAFNVISFVHPGGNVTIPYVVPHGTTLVLYVEEKPLAKKTVN